MTNLKIIATAAQLLASIHYNMFGRHNMQIDMEGDISVLDQSPKDLNQVPH
jgi:hypothetical protein